jgi:uncharacterized membrane protein YbhN (UPF0104 family)
MKKKNTIIYMISGVVTALLLAYIFFNLDWEVLGKAFSDLHWGWLGLALLVYLVNVVLRALRFANLIYSRPVHWLDLVPVSALHNVLVYLMPAQSGDVTYVFIAKNRLDLPLSEGTATLLASRYYDVSLVALILALLLPFSRSGMPDWIFRTAVMFCFIVLSGALAILVFLRVSQPGSNNAAAGGGENLPARIRSAWKKFTAGLREIQSHGAHARIALLTAGIWLCIYLNYYSAVQGMGLPISFHQIVIISVVMISLTLLPVQGFANVGTHEIGWASVLVAFHYPYDTALAIAVGSHFVFLMSVLISGGIAFFGAKLVRAFIVSK